MQNDGSKVAAEGSPEGTVGGGSDGGLVGVEEAVCLVSEWTVREGGAVSDEGVVGQGAVGNEDGGVLCDAEGEDGAVAGSYAAEEGLEVEGAAAEEAERSEEGDVGRARREAEALLLRLLSEDGEEEPSDEAEGDSEEEEERVAHLDGCRLQLHDCCFTENGI